MKPNIYFIKENNAQNLNVLMPRRRSCLFLFTRLGIIAYFLKPVTKYLQKVWQKTNIAEEFYARKMSVIQNIVNQLLVFSMCDILLCDYGEKQRNGLTGVNSLLFYYIITFFVKRIIDVIKVIESRTEAPRRSLIICVVKIVLEWAKAVVLIICLREQGLKAHPNLLYTVLTLVYYVCTESVFNEFFPKLLELMNIGSLEGLETLYSPVLLENFSITLCSILCLFLIANGHLRFSLLCLYHTVFIRLKFNYLPSLKLYNKEKNILQKFKNATDQDIAHFDDICAVCLSPMKTARVTPCQHLFHAVCLRQCYKNSTDCPICKRNINIQ